MGDMIFTHGRRNTCGCCHQRGYTVEFINKCTGLSLSIQCCSHNLASWEPVSRGYKRSGTFAESILYVFRLMLTCRNNCWSARNLSFVFRGGIPDLKVVFNFLHHNDIISILYFVEVVVDSYTNVVGKLVRLLCSKAPTCHMLYSNVPKRPSFCSWTMRVCLRRWRYGP